jgi:hypothetical protein
MRDRVKSLKRVLEVQKQLHSMEEVKYARLQQRLMQCKAEQDDLANALSEDGALHGLFMDVTVRRIQALQQEQGKLGPLMEAQARVLLDHGGRLRNSERLSEELAVELRRVEERDELEQLLEGGFARRAASSKQDG